MTTRTHTTAVFAPLARPRTSLLDTLAAFYAIWRQRQVLSGLEPHLLDDIAVTATMARNEASRPFWDIPSHWRG